MICFSNWCMTEQHMLGSCFLPPLVYHPCLHSYGLECAASRTVHSIPTSPHFQGPEQHRLRQPPGLGAAGWKCLHRSAGTCGAGKGGGDFAPPKETYRSTLPPSPYLNPPRHSLPWASRATPCDCCSTGRSIDPHSPLNPPTHSLPWESKATPCGCCSSATSPHTHSMLPSTSEGGGGG